MPISRELVKPVAFAAGAATLALLLAFLAGGGAWALVIGFLVVPVAWFTLGAPGLAGAASAAILTAAVLVFAQSVLEPAGSSGEVLDEADEDVRQARRIATFKFEAREGQLTARIARQRERLGEMTRRVERLTRRTEELRTALTEARRAPRARQRAEAGRGEGEGRRRARPEKRDRE